MVLDLVDRRVTVGGARDEVDATVPGGVDAVADEGRGGQPLGDGGGGAVEPSAFLEQAGGASGEDGLDVFG